MNSGPGDGFSGPFPGKSPIARQVAGTPPSLTALNNSTR